RGAFSVGVFDADGRPAPSTVVSGVDNPTRGWLSRYYGEKVAVPSMVAERRAELPITFVSLLSGAPYTASVDKTRWTIRRAAGIVAFDIGEGRIEAVSIQ